jgi:hypothetical protein
MSVETPWSAPRLLDWMPYPAVYADLPDWEQWRICMAIEAWEDRKEPLPVTFDPAEFR